jgi:hypothetical protein
MIKPPTVGRIVYFRPGKGARSMMNVRDDQPLRADIVYVWSDRNVSLVVNDHMGVHHFLEHVHLAQEGDLPYDGSYCEWMPYQKAVAKGEIAPTLHAAGSPHISTKGTELDNH